MLRFSAVLLVALAAPAGAATFVATSVEDMARASDAVVHARVVDTAARLARDGRIVTEVELAVDGDGAWKGAPGASLRLVVPGGTVGDLALWIDAAPTFVPGEEVVVFLARKGPAWIVNGLALGKFRVVGGEVRPAAAGARLLPPARALAAGERQVGAMPLAELEQRVRGAR